MNTTSSALAATIGSPVPQRRCYLSRPSITKEDVEKTEHMVVEAEKMVENAINNRATRNFHSEQAALKKLRESAEFSAKVEAFRKDQLSKEASLRPKSATGETLALERIEKLVNSFKASMQQEMRDAQLKQSAKKIQKSSEPCQSSVPLQVYKATSPPRQERRKMKIPRKSLPARSKPIIEKAATDLDEKVPIELSSTGFVHFPRHREDEDDWERVSHRSNVKSGVTIEEAAPSTKGFFKGWFSSK
ncbi:hypothetical protein BDW02DRAFT_549911 [Decorospora gaudefroyi]|uniref:Uncharacterized protein n=1 Tax=Decorospora gaudefroyi TaxID=184978 RepID=A0A6A5KJN6_9PLEO|nr:hypothetical protein BDW02DRAFT_549911 [Decorospora gaudefroyi]